MQRALLTGAHKWQFPDRQVEQLVKETEAKLASGKFFGIGEFIVRHWAYSPGRHAEQENPIDSTFMRRMSAIAARFDVPMVIHMEGYPALLARHPNLFCDLATMANVGNASYGTGWPRMEEITALIEQDGVLFPEKFAETNANRIFKLDNTGTRD